MKILFLLLIAINLNAGIDLSSSYTIGNDNYKMNSFSIDFYNDNITLSPQIKNYSSDILYSRTDYLLSLFYKEDKTKLKLELGYTPEKDGFSSTSYDGDIFYYIIENDNNSFGIGAILSYTLNKDYYSSTYTYVSGRKNTSTIQNNTAFELGENEIGGYIDFNIYSFDFNFLYSKFSYNESLTSSNRFLQTQIPDSTIFSEGFLDSNFSISSDFELINLTFNLSYTISKYLLDVPDSKIFSIGLTKDFKSTSISLNYDKEINTSKNYFGLSLSQTIF